MKRTIILLILTVASFTAHAQTVDVIIQQYIKHIGGQVKLEAIKSLKRVEKVKSKEIDYQQITLQKGNEKYKSYMSFKGLEIVASYDGNQVWATNPITMENIIIEGEDSYNILNEANDFPNALFKYSLNGYSVERRTDEFVAGLPCFKIALLRPDQTVMGQTISGESFYFIDKKTFMLVKKVETNAMGELASYFGNYRNVDGILYAFSIESEVNGNFMSETEIESYEVNKPADDALFSFPNN